MAEGTTNTENSSKRNKNNWKALIALFILLAQASIQAEVKLRSHLMGNFFKDVCKNENHFRFISMVLAKSAGSNSADKFFEFEPAPSPSFQTS